MSQWSQDSYLKALVFAGESHGSQKVPGSELPYLAHVSLVAMEVLAALVVEDGLDGNLAVQCALLHDVLEDTEIEYNQLKNMFGEKVADGVQALTKNNELPKEERMADSLARIRHQSKEVWMVKLADRITNLQPPPKHWTADKMQSYHQEAELIHDALQGSSPLLSARLKQKIDGYSQYFP